MLIRLSQPTGLFVALSDVKPHAVIDFDDDDDLLESYIKAATRFVEDRTGRILLPIDLEYRVAGWSEPICLPAFPVREVTEVVYLDEDHAEQTLDDGDWYLAHAGPDGRTMELSVRVDGDELTAEVVAATGPETATPLPAPAVSEGAPTSDAGVTSAAAPRRFVLRR